MAEDGVAFSRPVRVDHLPPRVSRETLVAEADERAALAAELGLEAIDSLSAKVEMEPIGRRGVVRVSGTLSAQVVQTCGVTLVSLPAGIDSRFDLTFAPPEGIEAPGAELDLSPTDLDPPDPIINGVVDLGLVVAEQLVLALDPFPRAPGAAFDSPADLSAAEEGSAPGPFAALAGLRQKLR